MLLSLFLYLQYPVWSGGIKRFGHFGGGAGIWNIRAAAHPARTSSHNQTPLSVLNYKGDGGSYESQNLEEDNLNLTFSLITTLIRT